MYTDIKIGDYFEIVDNSDLGEYIICILSYVAGRYQLITIQDTVNPKLCGRQFGGTGVTIEETLTYPLLDTTNWTIKKLAPPNILRNKT